MYQFRSKYVPIFLTCLLAVIAMSAVAQEKSEKSDVRKNTIKLNLTNPMIFGGKAIVIGYERVLSPNRSFSVDIGSMSLPSFGSGSVNDSVKLLPNANEKGFHISADYRFYLSKENKYPAPRGVYIGPYYSYNQFNRSNSWNLNATNYTGNVNTDLGFRVHTIGVEMGYQFVFNKKWVVDMVLAGPGMGFYKVNAALATTLPENQKGPFFDQLNNYLQEKIPGFNRVLGEGSLRSNGNFKTTALGFRYMINVGFRF